MSFKKKGLVCDFAVTEGSGNMGISNTNRADRLIKTAISQIEPIETFSGNRFSYFLYNFYNIADQIFGVNRGVSVQIKELAQSGLLFDSNFWHMPVVFRVQNRDISVFSKNLSYKASDRFTGDLIKNRFQTIPDFVRYSITVI